MKILIASDFYYEYELYKTSNRDNLIKHIKALASGAPVISEGLELIGDQDTIDTQDAIQQADEIIYVNELID